MREKKIKYSFVIGAIAVSFLLGIKNIYAGYAGDTNRTEKVEEFSCYKGQTSGCSKKNGYDGGADNIIYSVGTSNDPAINDFYRNPSNAYDENIVQCQDESTPTIEGMYSCIESSLHDGVASKNRNFNKVYGDKAIVVAAEKRIYFYDAGRVDVWGYGDTNSTPTFGATNYYANNFGGQFATNGNNVFTFPGMYLKYKVNNPKIPSEVKNTLARYIKKDASATLSDEEVSNYGLKLVSVSEINDYGSAPAKEAFGGSDDSTVDFWTKWQVDPSKLTIKETETGKANMNYEVTIDSLTTAGGPKSKIEGHEDIRLGYWSSIRPAFSKYNIGETPSSEIVYHYWVPYLAIFEFEPPHTIDCNNADDAYAYPNTCCWEFPETCCTSAGNAEKNVPSIKEVYDNSNEEVKKKIENTCCTNEPTIKFNTYTLPTFNSLDKKEEFLDNFPGKICPACSWTPNSDRYCCNEPPYKGSSYCPSDEETDKYCEDNDYFNKHKDICCQKDKYKNDTTKCPRPSDSCDDEEFFNNNKTMCCQQDKYKNDTTKCPVPTESCDDNKFFETNKNICCKLEKYVNDARCISKTNACTDETYFEGHKSTCCSDFSKDPNSSLWKTNAWQCCNEEDITNEAKATCDIPYVEPKNQSCDKDNSFDLKTTINGKNSFTETLSISAVDPYKNGSDNAKPKVSAGQGFKYDIHVKDKIVLDSNSTYPKGTANMNCNSVSSAFETYNKSIEDALKKIKADAIRKQIIYFKEDGSTESNYKFKYVYREAGKENELIDSINSKKVNVKKENTSVACIDYYYNPYSGINVPYNSSTNVTIYKPEITIDIDYDMTLPTYYISNNSNINDETEHTISDKNSPLYINGGNQFYTNVYDKTLKNGENARGTYWKGFSIQVENGGITVDNEGDETGRLKTTDSNKYTCSYRISKCLTEGSCPKDDNNTRFPSSSVSDAKEDYYSRPISLTTPFPNLRESGPNWNGTAKNGTFDLPTTYITSGTPTNPKGDKVYSKAMYSIKLTPELINNIKKYNNSQNDHGGYLDWEMTSYDDYKRTSKFLSCLNGTTSDCTTNMRSAGLNAKKTLNITLSDEARKNKIGEF